LQGGIIIYALARQPWPDCPSMAVGLANWRSELGKCKGKFPGILCFKGVEKRMD